MGDMGDYYNDLKEASKQKKIENLSSSLQLLEDNNIRFQKFSNTHIRIGDYDFWPSTGLFRNIKTNKSGRGVFNLMRRLGVSNG